MKLLKRFLKRFLQIFILLFLAANLFIVLSGRFYLYKGIYHTYLHGRTGPSIYDRDIFAYKTIKKSNDVYKWIEPKKKRTLSGEFLNKMESLKTSSFLVIQNDEIIFEKYWGDHGKQTVSNSFSAAKTFISLLIGAAIQDGKIQSIDEKVGSFIPSFNEGKKKNITIRHLLMMASGLDWEESGKNPLSENAESYYGTDLRGLIDRQKAVTKPGKHFNYQSGNSQALGFIIEKATGKSLSAYAYEKIWSKIGTEHDAYWSLDKDNGVEKSFCCLYGTTRDFARLGKLILNKGKWKSEQLIPETFMTDFFKNPELTTDEGIPNYRYGLHIWTYLGEKEPIYYCRGILGQYIILIPEKNIIIVRTGQERMKNINKDENEYKIGHPADLFIYISTAKQLVEQ